MIFGGIVSEDQMVRTFLLAEINSKRFGHHLKNLIKERGLDESVVFSPDFSNPIENNIRKALLDYRGYQARDALFAGFPSVLSWQEASLDLDEAGKLSVVNDSSWVEKTDETRQIASALNGLIDDVDHPYWEHINGCLAAINNGNQFPKVILVGDSLQNLVILEGHIRVLAYLKNSDPSLMLDALVAVSPTMKSWSKF